MQHGQKLPTMHPCRAPYIYTQGEGFGTGWVSSLRLPWTSDPSPDRAAALLLLASEAWVGVSRRLRTALSTGAANERRATDAVPTHRNREDQRKKRWRDWAINTGEERRNDTNVISNAKTEKSDGASNVNSWCKSSRDSKCWRDKKNISEEVLRTRACWSEGENNRET